MIQYLCFYYIMFVPCLLHCPCTKYNDFQRLTNYKEHGYPATVFLWYNKCLFTAFFWYQFVCLPRVTLQHKGTFKIFKEHTFSDTVYLFLLHCPCTKYNDFQRLTNYKEHGYPATVFLWYNKCLFTTFFWYQFVCLPRVTLQHKGTFKIFKEHTFSDTVYLFLLHCPCTKYNEFQRLTYYKEHGYPVTAFL